MNWECPNCERHLMDETTRDIPFTYKGETIVVEGIGGWACSTCDEFIIKPEESKRLDAVLREFRQGINAKIADPEFIVAVRKNLGLDQQEAGRIFGGGVNAFSRYETGRTKPPVPLMKLLKLLNNHPELFPEVR